MQHEQSVKWLLSMVTCCMSNIFLVVRHIGCSWAPQEKSTLTSSLCILWNKQYQAHHTWETLQIVFGLWGVTWHHNVLVQTYQNFPWSSEVLFTFFLFFNWLIKPRLLLKSIWAAHWKGHSFNGILQCCSPYYSILGIEEADLSHGMVI